MESIEIRYSYLSRKAVVTINGEVADPYNEDFTRMQSRPYLEVFPDIISVLDKMICDDYQIDFYGELFPYHLLLTTSKQSKYCKEVRSHRIGSLYTPTELLKRLSAIRAQNNIIIEKPSSITVYNPLNQFVPEKDYFAIVDSQNADIGIFDKISEIPSTIRVPVIISDDISFECKDGQINYFIPNDKMEMFWDYISCECVICPLIEKYIDESRYIILNAIQKAELDSIKNNVPGYYIGNVPTSLDKGTSSTIEFASFPATAFSLKSENTDIISSNANTIIARGAGNTCISIVNSKNEVVAQYPISVIQHQYVEKIRLIPRFEYLKSNERNRIDVIITPINSEDASSLTWSVSDPSIVRVDDRGNITALDNGTATITVSGYVVSGTLTVEVKPTLQGISFSQQSVSLRSGEIFILECNVNPANSPTENLIWELDNKAIASINPSKNGRKCQIIASTNYEGKGNVRCYDSNTKLGAICNIEVISRVKPSTGGKIALWCWIIGIFIPFLLPISAITGFYGLSNDPEPDHKTRYIICIIGSILTLLFWFSLAVG